MTILVGRGESQIGHGVMLRLPHGEVWGHAEWDAGYVVGDAE
jgi:hypothetical protein